MYKNIYRKITTVDGRTLNAIGMGDLQLELLNRSGKTVTIFKDAIHTPEMAFTLIFISRLDKAGFLVTFSKGMCTIPLFMARYCLRGRKKKSSKTPKIMPRTLKSLKMMILKINRHKKRIQNFTKVPKQPTQSYFRRLMTHKPTRTGTER
jgi:hypothetical protein